MLRTLLRQPRPPQSPAATGGPIHIQVGRSVGCGPISWGPWTMTANVNGGWEFLASFDRLEEGLALPESLLEISALSP